MNDLKHLLNKLAKEQNFTTAQGIIPYAPSLSGYDCTGIDNHLNSILLTNPNTNIWRLVTGNLRGVLSNVAGFFWFLCSANNGPGLSPIDSLSKQEFRQGFRNIQTEIQKAICLIAWGLSNGLRFPGIHPAGYIARAILRALVHMFEVIDMFFNNESHPRYGKITPSILCSIIAWQIIEVEGFVKDPIGRPILDPQRVPITCPVSAWESVLLALADVVSEDALDLIGNILSALGLAIAAAVGAAAAWPFIFGGWVYINAVLAAKTVATTAIAALLAAGLITVAEADAANEAVGDVVDGVEACGPDTTDTGLEEEEKGEGEGGGCCDASGVPQDPDNETDCLNEFPGGYWVDDMHLGCVVIPDGEK